MIRRLTIKICDKTFHASANGLSLTRAAIRLITRQAERRYSPSNDRS